MAIAFRNDAIHVKSFSWGPPDDGASLVAMQFETAEALATAVQSGRSGRGTVFVWAAGNGGDLDNCNFDGFASSRYVLAVGAVGDDAQRAPLQRGLLGAVRGGAVQRRRAQPHDDRPRRRARLRSRQRQLHGSLRRHRRRCPGGERRRRADAVGEPDPHPAGRQAHPAAELGRLQPDDPGWTTGPFPHSEIFGFGLVDARAAVTAARTWTSVGPGGGDLLEASSSPGLVIPAGVPAGVTDQIVIDPTPFADFTVEQVSVEFSATHPRRGDLEVTLISPLGVESHLATLRPSDTGANFSGWVFGSVRHWGELAAGTWQLRVADRGAGGPGRTFDQWTLRIYGSPGGAGDTVASGQVRTASGPLAGVTMTFSGGGVLVAPVQTDAGGNWAQTGFTAGATYTVTPSLQGFELHAARASPSTARATISISWRRPAAAPPPSRPARRAPARWP